MAKIRFYMLINYLGVTDPFRNNCKNSCLIAMSHAICGATSQMKPRNRDLPQNRKMTIKMIFSSKKTHVTPEMS